jgi:hypothetical protein
MKVSDLEQDLERYGALRDLETLVDAGRERSEMLNFLVLVFLADDSWKAQIGMDRRMFDAAIKQVEDCASLVERLNRSKLLNGIGLGVLGEPAGHSTLASGLRKYAGILHRLRLLAGPKSAHKLNAWKSCVTAVVLERTGKPHDREVASISSVALRDPKYGEPAHKQWRLRHKDMIQAMRQEVR